MAVVPAALAAATSVLGAVGRRRLPSTRPHRCDGLLEFLGGYLPERAGVALQSEDRVTLGRARRASGRPEVVSSIGMAMVGRR
jgi:hypothetical protein